MNVAKTARLELGKHPEVLYIVSKNPNHVFPEMKLHSFVPNSDIHISVSDLYIPSISLPIWLQQTGRPILGIYKSLTGT